MFHRHSILVEIESDGTLWTVTLDVSTEEGGEDPPAPTKEKFDHVASQMDIYFPGWVQTQMNKEP